MPSRWLPAPSRLLQLLAGLWLFGAGEALLVSARLGNSPWTVFAQGISRHTPLAVGTATIAVSAGVLMLWVPLRQPPGLGTLLNAVLIGVAIDATLSVLPHARHIAPRAVEVPAGIALVALGSGLYLTTRLGPGPRDGLMTGLSRRLGYSLRLVRGCIEGSVLVAGWLLGGRVGVGTVAFAALIGPAVQRAVRALDRHPLHPL